MTLPYAGHYYIFYRPKDLLKLMRPIRTLSLFSALAFIPPVASAASAGVSPYGYELFNFLGIPITNAFVTGIVLATVLVLILRAVIGKPQLVPTKGQAVVETVVDAIQAQMEPIVGKKMVRPTFPIIASVFFFILIHNWSGLIPGVGAFGHVDGDTFEYYFRPANTDVNNTIALAIAVHIVWLYLIFKHAGLKSIVHHIFGNKAEKEGTSAGMYLFLTGVFIIVGLIEMVSIGIRPVTLSMRLFGNIFGGENLLENIYTLSSQMHPLLFALAGIPFYFLELLVGFVQAVVFSLLTCVYVGLLCNHDDDH